MSTTSSALLNPVEPHDAAHSEVALGRPGASEPQETHAALRLQVAERLAAHRNRRSGAHARSCSSSTRTESARSHTTPPTGIQSPATRSARIAATVAQRYAQSPSYRAFLAAEAERAIQQAHAAAEVAALNAQAVAAAQQSLLEVFDRDAARSSQTAPAPAESAAELTIHPRPESVLSPQPSDQPSDLGGAAEKNAEALAVNAHTTPLPHSSEYLLRSVSVDAGLTVRFYEETPSTSHRALEAARPASGSGDASRLQAQADAEALALDEEIAFRQSPVFEESAGPSVPLPANLIEFPRQLIASRKARPRYAEGPLRDAAHATPADGQLRIFEVDPAQISTQASSSGTGAEFSAPQWTSLWLDTPAAPTHPAAEIHLDADADIAELSAPTLHAPQPATLARRALAATIDAATVAVGLFAFIAAFALTSTHPYPLPAALPGLPQLLEHPFPSHAIAGFAGCLGMPINLLAITGGISAGFLYLLYQSLFFTLADATPGMRCARIALCTLDDENPGRAAMRRRIPAVLLSACPLGLGFLWVALDEDRLAWHDRISRMYQRSY